LSSKVVRCTLGLLTHFSHEAKVLSVDDCGNHVDKLEKNNGICCSYAIIIWALRALAVGTKEGWSFGATDFFGRRCYPWVISWTLEFVYRVANSE
jgi:hypothetical protein